MWEGFAGWEDSPSVLGAARSCGPGGCSVGLGKGWLEVSFLNFPRV